MEAIDTPLDFISAKNILTNQDLATKRNLQNIDAFFKARFEWAKKEPEKRIESLFYLLMAKLKSFSMETPETSKYFFLFLQEMEAHISSITKESIHTKGFLEEISDRKTLLSSVGRYIRDVSYRFHILENRIKTNHVKIFLKLCEYYIHTLWQIYKDLGMSDRVTELYIIRMNLKRGHVFFSKQFGTYFGFTVFRTISLYGTSFTRLSITCFSSIILFGSIYWLADFFAPENLRMIKDMHEYSNYLFNSLATISGLGIDASPSTGLQRLAMGINAIYGMIVFGMLFNVISTKLSMNN